MNYIRALWNSIRSRLAYWRVRRDEDYRVAQIDKARRKVEQTQAQELARKEGHRHSRYRWPPPTVPRDTTDKKDK